MLLFNGKCHAYVIEREQNTVYGSVTWIHYEIMKSSMII